MLSHETSEEGVGNCFYSRVTEVITKNLTFQIPSHVTCLHEYKLYTDIQMGMADVPKVIKHFVIRIWNELQFGASFLVASGINE